MGYCGERGRSQTGFREVGQFSLSSDLMLMRCCSDLSFLALPPPQISSTSGALSNALASVRSLVKHFEESFAYIKGFDAYTVQVRRSHPSLC